MSSAIPVMKMTAYAAALSLVLLLIKLTLHDLLVRPDLHLYVLDERRDGGFGQDLLHLFPDADQQLLGLRVVVHEVKRQAVVTDQSQWRNALAVVADKGGDAKFFVKLDSPAAGYKKLLRAAIEDQFSGEQRRQALRRVIAFVGVESDTASEACDQLRDDWIFLKDNFGGFALAVDEGSLKLLADCLPRFLIAFHTGDH